MFWSLSLGLKKVGAHNPGPPQQDYCSLEHSWATFRKRNTHSLWSSCFCSSHSILPPTLSLHLGHCPLHNFLFGHHLNDQLTHRHLTHLGMAGLLGALLAWFLLHLLLWSFGRTLRCCWCGWRGWWHTKVQRCSMRFHCFKSCLCQVPLL